MLRGYWDGASKPSIETPVGDFFGLNLGDYVIFESQYIACSPGRSLNSYFAMPYRKGARFTVTNEGPANVGAFYSNIDYLEADSIPDDALYFHAQYRQAVPTTKETLPNSEGWMGEGDDMIFIDNPSTPTIIGTGSEDYFLGSWNFGGRLGAQQFSHLQYGAPLIQSAERVGGRYCLYRFHGDNPVTFNTYLKHTMEHGHANNRADNYYSCAFWYQEQPYTDFPALPAVAQRVPHVSG